MKKGQTNIISLFYLDYSIPLLLLRHRVYSNARMVVFVAFVVFIASSGGFACDTTAPLPKLEQPLDWGKVKAWRFRHIVLVV